MKKSKIFILIIIMLFLSVIKLEAASFGLSSSTKQVSPNSSFTISVGGDSIGRVDLSISNGTLSTTSVWVEENYVTVNVTAGTSGNVVITATPIAGFSDSDANPYNPGSRSVTVNIASSSSGNNVTTRPTINTPIVKKSGDNNLSSLTVSVGELSPSFNSSQSEYTLSLPSDTTTLDVNAVLSDTKATVDGLGTLNLNPGNNNIEIIVTAENGDKKTYIIKAFVDDKPLVYLDYKDKKIGVVRNFEGVIIPENFNKEEHIINEKKITIFTKDKISIISGLNEENTKDLFLFDKEKNTIISKFIPININRELYVIDKEITKDNLILDKVTINEKEIDCYKFNENNDYCLLSVVNNEGKVLEYLYEKSENTLQLYPEFLTNCYQTNNHNNVLFYILILVNLLLLGSIIFLLLKKGDKHEKKK